MKILRVNQVKQSKTNTLICNLFLSQAKNSKTTIGERRVTTAEVQNTQQRNRKSTHFFILTALQERLRNEETQFR